MDIISYNVNGIRAAQKKELLNWLDSVDVDVFCIQESKAQQEQVDVSEFEARGFKDYWHSAEKKGYSGVVTFAKKAPDLVVEGCGIEAYDKEGRVIRTDFGDLTILNCYFPSGTSGDIRQTVKMEFLADFQNWINQLKKERPNLIIVGDYNIAHTEMDIHNPKSNKKTSGFLPEEREWMSQWFDSGFTDAFRSKHPEKVEYSWWSYRAGARKNNKGWRIDYQSVSDPLKDKIIDAGQYNDAVHSDHCPVWLKLDWKL
ncbi:MAG: exodeoxyribonuclease III [Saprospiraceae bacterium]|nr:exodeoxyribonuclease III [Saprospiraceae bacterium]